MNDEQNLQENIDEPPKLKTLVREGVVAKEEHVEATPGIKLKKIPLWMFMAGAMALILLVCLVIFIRLMAISENRFGDVMKMIQSGNLACFSGHDLGEADCTHGRVCSRCGIELGKLAAHQYDEATCTHLATCAVCGKTTGQLLAHQWSVATCTKGSFCKVCQKENGKALGHTTSLGQCERCGKEQHGEVFDSLAEQILLIITNDNNGIAKVNAGANASYLQDAYDLFVEGKNCFAADVSMYEQILAICSTYKELAKLQEVLEKAKSQIPLSDFNKDKGQMQVYLDQVNAYVEAIGPLVEYYTQLTEHQL